MYQPSSLSLFQIFQRSPDAKAYIKGNADYPELSGIVYFYQVKQGVLTLAEIDGLPYSEGKCTDRVFGFHIHEGDSCTGNETDSFADTGGHYNPSGCEHPHHAGDLPPLFGSAGTAVSLFLTDRFTAREIVGKTVVIHDHPDDFKSQPAGDSGRKIACGEIMSN